MPDSLFFPNDEDDSPGHDRLEGASAIAQYYYGNTEHKSVKRIYYAAEAKTLPIGKQGTKLIASKRKLREHYSKLTDIDLPAKPEPDSKPKRVLPDLEQPRSNGKHH